MGMEMTASCESGQKCSRPTTPIIPTPPRYYYTYFFVIFVFFHLLNDFVEYQYTAFVSVILKEKKPRQNPFI